jgi:predicted amidohydrolase
MEYRETVSIACINFCPEWGDKAANLSKIKTFAKQAADQGNNIIVFPELALTGYECSETSDSGKKSCTMHKEQAEIVPGPSTNELIDLASDLDVYIIFGMPEQDTANPDLLYISSVVIGPEGLLGTYRKLHLAPLPRFTESLCFTPGNEVPVFETRYGIIGVLICYDFYFYPELARIMALKGADLLFNTSASATGPGKPYFIVQQTGSRATENGVYCASANLVGKERTNSYYGHSVIAGPLTPRPAFIFAEGGETEEIVSATLSLKGLRVRKEQLNWQKDRQADLINAELGRLTHN